MIIMVEIPNSMVRIMGTILKWDIMNIQHKATTNKIVSLQATGLPTIVVELGVIGDMVEFNRVVVDLMGQMDTVGVVEVQ